MATHDDMLTPQPLRRWFWWAAGATLLFELFGAASIANVLTVDPSSLPVDQRAMMAALPGWMKAASVVAVTTGVSGAIGLLLRRRWAERLLLASLVAVLVQDSAYLIHQPLLENTTSDQLLVPAIVLAMCAAIYWFARYSRVRGWLV